MTIGERIKKLRLKRGMTQKQLGELCEMNEANIRKYESNRQNPKKETLDRIADALKTNRYYLETGTVDLQATLDALAARSPSRQMLSAMEELNDEGKHVAVERVRELKYVPKYQKTKKGEPESR